MNEDNAMAGGNHTTEALHDALAGMVLALCNAALAASLEAQVANR